MSRSDLVSRLQAHRSEEAWNLSTSTLECAVSALRQAATGDDHLDVGELWALCDEAADIIQGLMHYEMSHGLRATRDSDDEG
jgi:hypothetical protein